MFTFTLYLRSCLPELLITCSSRSCEKSSESVPLMYSKLSSFRLFISTAIELRPVTVQTSFLASTPQGSESGL